MEPANCPAWHRTLPAEDAPDRRALDSGLSAHCDADSESSREDGSAARRGCAEIAIIHVPLGHHVLRKRYVSVSGKVPLRVHQSVFDPL